jgi:DNA-binding MarR family transcriptional regulator
MDKPEEALALLIRLQERSDFFEYLHEDILGRVNLTEAHFVDCVGTHEGMNVTEIAAALSLTKGAVSKIYKKLIAKGLIERYQNSRNAKEVYFKLTEDGAVLYEQHRIVHQKAEQEWADFFNEYSDSEQTVIVRFLTGLNELYAKEQEHE